MEKKQKSSGILFKNGSYIKPIETDPDKTSRSSEVIYYHVAKLEDYFRPYKIEKGDKLWAKDEEDANYIADTLGRYGYETRIGHFYGDWSVAVLEVGDEQKMYGDVFEWQKQE